MIFFAFNLTRRQGKAVKENLETKENKFKLSVDGFW
jgi:hypothetical protein